MGTLARSQAARRRRVLDATLRLAASGGFEAVQMRDVAAEAGVALGTVYRYFASKERLLLEAMIEQQRDLRTHLHEHPPAGATPVERVIDVLASANASLSDFPDVGAAMVRAFGSARPEHADLLRAITEIMTDVITWAITGRPDVEPTARDLAVARVLQEVWFSALIAWVGGVDPVERVLQELSTAAHLLLD